MFQDYFGQWLTKPFSQDMDWMHWVLFVAFLVTVAFLWMQVLSYIIEED